MLRAAFRSACAVWPQDRQTKRAWLSRDSAAVYPQAWHRCDVYAALTFSTRPGAFCSSRVTSTPQPLARMARFSPAFCRTFVPGASTVPLAERVMLRTRRSSTRISGWRVGCTDSSPRFLWRSTPSATPRCAPRSRAPAGTSSSRLGHQPRPPHEGALRRGPADWLSGTGEFAVRRAAQASATVGPRAWWRPTAHQPVDALARYLAAVGLCACGEGVRAGGREVGADCFDESASGAAEALPDGFRGYAEGLGGVFGAGAVGSGQVDARQEVSVVAADDLLGDGPGEDLEQVGLAGRAFDRRVGRGRRAASIALAIRSASLAWRGPAARTECRCTHDSRRRKR